MDEHGNLEIAGGEESGNVRQVGPDLIARGVVMFALDFHADGAAVRQQDEMMRGGLMGETHAMIATRVDRAAVLVGRDVILILHTAAHHRILSVSTGSNQYAGSQNESVHACFLSDGNGRP